MTLLIIHFILLAAAPFKKFPRLLRTGMLLASLTLLAFLSAQVTSNTEHLRLDLFLMIVDLIVLWTLLYQVYFPPESAQFIFQMIKNALRLSGSVGLILLIVVTLFPKLSFRFFSVQLQKNVVGFGSGSEMNPGEIAELTRSEEVAFTARLPETKGLLTPESLYWRGSTLSRTLDGLHWFQGKEFFPKTHAEVDSQLQQHILIEPRFEDVLFALDQPLVSPKLPKAGPLFEKTLYQASSSTLPFKSEFDPAYQLELSRVPFNLDPRLEPWVLKLKKENPSLQAFSKALLHYYETNFQKKLNPGKYSKDALGSFFYDRKEGFCEHFAGSFATLLRMAGFYSRVVLGFKGGEWNPWSKSYVVHDYDAHAWVEAWDPQANQWTRIDPTQVVPPYRLETNTHSTLSQYYDSVFTRWNYFYHDNQNEKKIGFLLVLFLVFFSLYQARKRYRQRVQNQDPLVSLYERYCKELEKLSIKRLPHEGPNDFLMRNLKLLSAENRVIQHSLENFTQTYIQARYAEENTINSIKKLQEALSSVQLALKSITPVRR